LTITVDDVVYGCTDSEATNYNPDANVDDGTCEYPECDFTELFFNLGDSYGDGCEGLSVLSNLDGDSLMVFGGAESGLNSNDGDYTVYGPVCLEDGIYIYSFSTEDYWTSEFSFFVSLSDGTELVSGGFSTDGGGSIDVPFGLNVDLISGCMDSEASNYDPDANYDDGSCEYDCVFNPLTLWMFDSYGDSWNGNVYITTIKAILSC
jgi:hypothetical protein